MAVAKYGVIITELKGKIQGTVFQGGNTATIMRNLGYRKGTSSLRRSQAVNNIGYLSALWKDVSGAQKAAWTTAATQWVFYDKFGTAYYGNGYQVWLAYNAARRSLGLAVEYTPNVPVTPTDTVFDNVILDLSAEFNVFYTQPGVTGDYMQIWASPPMSPGVNDNNKRFKLMGSYNADGFSIFDIKADYIAAYGTPIVSQKIIMHSVLRRDAYPYPYLPFTFSGIVQA